MDALSKNRSCVSYGSNALTEGLEHLQGLILEDGRNGTIQCPHNQCCFGIWDLNQGQLQAKVQGCWISEKEACDSPACEFRSSAAITLSCRCRSDLCNANISYADPGKRPDDICALLFYLCSELLAWSRQDYLDQRNLPPTDLPMFLGISREDITLVKNMEYVIEKQISLCDLLVLRHRKVHAVLLRPKETGELNKLLHEGQLSKLWQGTFGQQPVAIKAFPPLCHQQFASEWAVYSLPLMNHENVVRLVTAGYGGPSEEHCGLLVLTLIRLGSSLARGLAFLHEEKRKEGLHKPGVAHRDLSSQNVLDVGSALRQADVYSLALVLWEILMRCSALFPENSIPEFQLAYEAELGSSPTYSELRRLAVEERRRPIVPPAWTRFGQLLEDCWDPEPEARLQAECALQRLQRLGTEDL
ncbi:hypothetical protein E2320_016320, partial [Naja naja]